MGVSVSFMRIFQLSILATVASIACVCSSWADPTLFLPSPKDAANVRINLAHEAKSEVIAAYYKFNMDRAGLTTLVQLRDAARKGKRAVLVLDSFGSQIPKSMLSYLTFEGVEIYEYNPFDWKHPLQYLRRLHSKIFVVDGKYLVTGDRNIGSEYFGLTDESFISRDIYTEGKAAQQARAHVEELIRSDEVKRILGSKISPVDLRSEKEKLDLIEAKRLTQQLRKKDAWKQGIFDSEAVEFYHDPVGQKGTLPGVDARVIEAIDRAKSSITFENAYVILPENLRNALERAAKRGVRLRVLTNSGESTDVKLVAVAWERSREFLASIGSEVWEHPGSENKRRLWDWLKSIMVKEDSDSVQKFRKLRTFITGMRRYWLDFSSLHAKTMVIDDMDSYVMSYNFDSRSEKVNMEVAAHVKGAKFAAALNAEIEKDLKQSKYRLVAANGSLRLPEGAKTSSCVARAISRIIENQL